MAKKTTKKKPVTMAERIRRIELDVNRHGANIAAMTAAMREQLDKIEREVSLIRSGASFMQELEKAKEMGLTPVVAEAWEPKAGDWVTCVDTPDDGQMSVGSTWRVVSTNNDRVQTNNPTCRFGWYSSRFRPATPEEIAKYHADQQAAKPITPFTTRVKTTGGEEWLVIHGPSPGGHYTLQRNLEGYCDTLLAERHEFTVIE